MKKEQIGTSAHGGKVWAEFDGSRLHLTDSCGWMLTLDILGAATLARYMARVTVEMTGESGVPRAPFVVGRTPPSLDDDKPPLSDLCPRCGGLGLRVSRPPTPSVAVQYAPCETCKGEGYVEDKR